MTTAIRKGGGNCVRGKEDGYNEVKDVRKQSWANL